MGNSLLEITPLILLYALLTTFVTESIIRAAKLSRGRWAQLISIIAAIIISLIDCVVRSNVDGYSAVLTGLLIALIANGGYDAIKRIIGTVKQ